MAAMKASVVTAWRRSAALDVEVVFPEPSAGQPGADHPHHLGALIVDRVGVEVVDLGVGLRLDRMSGRAIIFGELVAAQGLYGFDAPRA